MKKIFFLSAATLFLCSTTSVFSQTIDEFELEDQQQQQATQLTEEEFNSILSVGCNSSYDSRSSISRALASEVNTSLSSERSNELTEAVLEIKALPTQEMLALCQGQS